MGIFNFFSKKAKQHKFSIVGYSHECKYKKNGFANRQDALRQTLPGDTVTLKKYTYRGLPAFAVVSDRLKCDLGVIKQTDVKRVIELFGADGIHGSVSRLYAVYGKQYSDDENNNEDNDEYDLITFNACDIVIEESR